MRSPAHHANEITHGVAPWKGNWTQRALSVNFLAWGILSVRQPMIRGERPNRLGVRSRSFLLRSLCCNWTLIFTEWKLIENNWVWPKWIAEKHQFWSSYFLYFIHHKLWHEDANDHKQTTNINLTSIQFCGWRRFHFIWTIFSNPFTHKISDKEKFNSFAVLFSDWEKWQQMQQQNTFTNESPLEHFFRQSFRQGLQNWHKTTPGSQDFGDRLVFFLNKLAKKTSHTSDKFHPMQVGHENKLNPIKSREFRNWFERR